MGVKITWPENKQFAFTVFDDTDAATLENVGPVYAFLRDCGFRTTKSCWPVAGDPRQGTYQGQTCEDADYLHWAQELQAQGFEIGWHNATWHGLPREGVLDALDAFHRYFGQYPVTATNHNYDEGIYWGDNRLNHFYRLIYQVVTRRHNAGRYRGHIEGDKYFWGDLCKERIKYYRNFVFQDINTLKACPVMPYHDPQRPYVNYWFASANGKNVREFNRCLREKDQDRLEEEGGACIMYTHFASGFSENGKLEPRFRTLMERLSKKNGWFVPVATLLDHLLAAGGPHVITDAQRHRLERKWLLEKIFIGTK
ncbi:MAG: hypothetical protein JXB10_09525 [Pirellulales bacterium]|nr:hypothetical protein [Pirellulales bacterium]